MDELKVGDTVKYTCTEYKDDIYFGKIGIINRFDSPGELQKAIVTFMNSKGELESQSHYFFTYRLTLIPKNIVSSKLIKWLKNETKT